MLHESAQRLRDDLVARINEALARGMTLEDVSIVVRDVARETQALYTNQTFFGREERCSTE